MLSKEVVLKIIGENIREYREERKMSIEELSKITGIKLHYLKRIELGKAKRLNLSHIFIFAMAFKIKPHEIVRGL